MLASPEFRLAIACCRGTFAKVDLGEIDKLCAAVDWLRFLRLVRFHRVQGLVWKCLASTCAAIPLDAAEALSSDAEDIAVANLRAAAECRNLLAAFEETGIPVLFVKGLTLGVLAYGNASAKAAIDIDLVVPRAALKEASSVLQKRAFHLIVPPGDLTVASIQAWHSSHKESVWFRPEDRLQIDLHTRLADNLALIPSLTAKSSRQEVEVAPAIILPTLSDDELFAYLAVHGASSAWFRLKWIVDFAAFLHGRSGDEIERLYRCSQDLGAGRATGQALLLADALFDTLTPIPELRLALHSNWPTRLLYQAALRTLARAPFEPTQRWLGTLVIHWTQLLLLPGAGFKLRELWRQIRDATA